MTKKILGGMFLIFCVLVLGNYLFSVAGSFFPRGGVFFARADQSAGPIDTALPSIDFNFFSPNGVGRDYITQGYGRTPYAYLYMNGWHNGIDIAVDFGTSVYSPANGTVLATIDQDEYCPHIAFGKYVAIDDTTNHLVLMFSHLGTLAISPGETIKRGTLLGVVGPTGLETGPHLLFSIFKEQGFVISPAHGCGPYPQGQDVDPLNYIGTTYQPT